jgi:hypothetical protein
MGDYTLLIRIFQDFKRIRLIAISRYLLLPDRGVLYLKTVEHLLDRDPGTTNDSCFDRSFESPELRTSLAN